MFCKLRKKSKLGSIVFGVDLKRCAECTGPTRPCEVDGKVCRFHRFVEEDRLLLKVNAFTKPDLGDAIRRQVYETGVVDPTCSAEVMRETRALIEWPDGSLSPVAVDRVHFLDLREG